ncbi:hypothetical protein D3C87_298970 [compost metagenome]
MDPQRTIETILDVTTGELIESGTFFNAVNRNEAAIFLLRTDIEKRIQTNDIRHVCIFCKQPVALRGRSGQQTRIKTFYFTHLYNSDDCIIKTNHRLTEEQVRCIKYNGEKESILHEQLKNLIARYLNLDPSVSDVRVEQTYRDLAISKDWRKPDVLAVFGQHTIAFELQLSTTFLSVIVGRTLFYQERNVFLLWVFPHFSLDSDIQKFTQKDVYYNNAFHVYVFDRDAQVQSEKQGRLIIKCYYQEFYIDGDKIRHRWAKSFIGLTDLIFDPSNCTLFYKDVNEDKKALENALKQQQEQKKADDHRQTLERRVSNALQYLREYYSKDIDPVPDPEYCPLQYIVTNEEIEELERQLKFTSEKAIVIANLFLDNSKPRFLQFLCEQDNVRVDLSKVLINGQTVLEQLLSKENEYIFQQSVCQLFRMGYYLNEQDRKVMASLFEKNEFNTTEWEKQCISRWTFVTCLSSLWNKEHALDLAPVRTTLNALMSLKHNMIIGSKLHNLRQVSMNFFEFHKGFGAIYIQAMKHFRQYDQQLSEDKNGKLAAKIAAFHQNTPIQKTMYNNIFYEIFPDL